MQEHIYCVIHVAIIYSTPSGTFIIVVISATMTVKYISTAFTLILQVNEKSFKIKEGRYKKEGDKTGKTGCMLPW